MPIRTSIATLLMLLVKSHQNVPMRKQMKNIYTLVHINLASFNSMETVEVTSLDKIYKLNKT